MDLCLRLPLLAITGFCVLRSDNAIDHLPQIRLMHRLGGCDALQRGGGVAIPPWIVYHV